MGMLSASYPEGRSVKIPYNLALVGLIVGVFMLIGHVPRRVIEVELAATALAFLYAGRSIGVLERQAAKAQPMAPLVAIIGCDGSGKSTLAADMRTCLAKERPVETCYLGLGSGELGNRIRRWPVIGPIVERKLAQKASQTRDKSQKIPGVITALVVFAFSLARMRRFRRVLALRRSGVTVITDRYPQTEVVGFYDGPGLSAARAGGPAVAWLAARERRMYEWMSSFRPDVVLRLHIDAQTAYDRKPDHDLALLHKKVEATSRLRFHGARIVEIDAAAAYPDVQERAFSHVRSTLAMADRAKRG